MGEVYLAEDLTLGRKVDLKSPFLVTFTSEPKLDELRNDAQFRELARRIGFPGATPTI